MADTLERRTPRSMGIGGHLWNAVAQAVCARRGHHWRPYGKLMGNSEWNLPFGRHDYCSRCESGQVTFKEGGAPVVASKAEIMAVEPRFAEALYEARWGEPPRRRLWRGEWPAV